VTAQGHLSDAEAIIDAVPCHAARGHANFVDL
jgi:hypothetical protein